MLIQLHWQNPQNPDETQFVSQDEYEESKDDTECFASQSKCLVRIRKKIAERKSECPDGWMPMICTESYKHFVWAAPNQNT